MSIELIVDAGIVGILTGSLLAENSKAYWQTIFEYMGSRTAMTATLLLLLVSVYGNILKSDHIVEELVWAADMMNMSPHLYTRFINRT